MYSTKQELFRGYEPVTDLDQRHCFVIVPEIADSILHIRFLGGKQNDRIHVSTPLQVDRLFGKWLKINRYFQVPKGYHMSAMLFLQPIWLNEHFGVDLSDRGREVLWSIPSTRGNGCDPPWILGCHERWASANSLILSFSLNFAFPFVVVRSTSGVVLIREDFVCYEALSFKEIYNFGLAPTWDPTIFLLTFSNLLTTEKDCAKLLRCYLKYPSKYQFGSAQLSFICRSEVETINFYQHNLTWQTTDTLTQQQSENNDCPSFAKDVEHDARNLFTQRLNLV